MEIPGRYALESSFAARMARLSSKHRQELLQLLGSPPDVTRVPDSFWMMVEEETRRELAIVLLLLFAASATAHGADSRDAEQRGADWAWIRSRDLAAGYAGNSRDKINSAAPRWGGDGGSSQDAVDDVTSVFGPDRAERMAVTETTAAQSAGSEWAVQFEGLQSLQDTWFTANDDRVCPVCGPLHATERSDWQAEFPGGPPAHPNCRCWIQYANVQTPAIATS